MSPFSFADFTDETLFVDGNEYSYVATCYLACPATIDVEYDLYSVADNSIITSVSVSGVKLARNYRTNVCGDIVADPVEIEPWDGATLTEPTTDAGDPNRYIIESPENLAWLAVNGLSLSQDKTFSLTQDLDMGGFPITSVDLPSGSAIEGNDKTIKNLNLTTGALFGNASDVTISDLNFEVAQFDGATGHVGALVNTLTGSGEFTNVNVTASTLTKASELSISTTNGAAGGLIGYVKPAKDGDALTVTISGCEISGFRVSGSVASGKLVGLLRGYCDKEELLIEETTASSVLLSDARAESGVYVEGNEACFIASNDYSAYNNFLGGSELYRGKVQFDTLRTFVPKWDGKTSTTPLTENGSTLIYTCFDLASMQGKGSVKMTFKNDVDLAGAQFVPIQSATTLTGNNKTLYGLFVEDEKTPFYGAAFVRMLGGSTVKDFTIDGARILGHPNTDTDDHKAYGGVLSGYVTGANTIENIKILNSYVKAVGKIGGLIGTIQDGSASTTITNCVVDGCTVENFKVDAIETFEAGGGLVTADFTQNGEAGGFMGFVAANVTVTNCHVTNSTIDCYGEKNQKKTVIIVSAIIPGRHVNAFIGDVRTTNAQTIRLVDCSASNNNVKIRYGSQVVDGGTRTYNKSKKKYCDLVGCAYAIYIKVLGQEKGSDKPGTLKDNSKSDISNINFVKTMATSDWNGTEN